MEPPADGTLSVQVTTWSLHDRPFVPRYEDKTLNIMSFAGFGSTLYQKKFS